MRKTVKEDLNRIADYVEAQTEFDVRSGERDKKEEVVAARYLFYVLGKEYTDASNTDLGAFTNRDRASASVALTRHTEYVKEYHKQAYRAFNPFKTTIKAMENPFEETIKILYDAKEQLEAEMFDLEKENKDVIDYLLRQVRNEKVFEILKMVKPLNKDQLDVVLERLPPIIKMAQ